MGAVSKMPKTLDLGHEVGGLHSAHNFAKSDWVVAELVINLFSYPCRPRGGQPQEQATSDCMALVWN